MSIQEAVLKEHSRWGKLYKVYRKIITRLNIINQQIFRFFFKDHRKVFYPYYDMNGTHPAFLKYSKHSPIIYSNEYNAKLYHCINYLPSNMPNVRYIIEPNDNPLAATAMYEPYQALKNIEKAIETYRSFNCKKILLESEGQMALFEHYLPQELLQKVEIVRVGAIALDIDLTSKYSNITTPVFLCLASDYKKKAVDLVLEAWILFKDRGESKLILACPNVPEDLHNLLKQNNVELITKVPLTQNEKDVLLKSAHVMIAPTHVDGGANIIEAFEYGLPVVAMRSQRSFIRDGNGWEVEVPFYFYDTFGYGKIWPTWKRYWEIVEEAKRDHKFNKTVSDFVSIFSSIQKNPLMLLPMAQKSHELAKGEFSFVKRNAKLLEIYNQALR